MDVGGVEEPKHRQRQDRTGQHNNAPQRHVILTQLLGVTGECFILNLSLAGYSPLKCLRAP